MFMSTVIVTGTTLIASGTTFSVSLGQPPPVQTIATFSDMNVPSNEDIMFVIDWGDGQTTSGKLAGQGSSELYTVMATHTYPVVALATSPVTGPPPSVPVTVTITDPSGQSAVAYSTALIVNAAPSIAALASALPSSSSIGIPSGASKAAGDVLGNGTTDLVVGAVAGDLPIVTIYDSVTGPS